MPVALIKAVKRTLANQHVLLHNYEYSKHNNNNNDHFTALCQKLPRWAGTRRNVHPPTILNIPKSKQINSWAIKVPGAVTLGGDMAKQTLSMAAVELRHD